MNSQPTFSIILPAGDLSTGNAANYLAQALDSLLAQTDPDWEALVVNDFATASILDDVRAYADRDTRIRLISSQQRGATSALNEALRHAQGQWLCWLNPDDLFDPRKLEIHRQYSLQEPHTSFFHTHFSLLHKEDSESERHLLPRNIPEREWQVLEMLRANYIQNSSICIKREAIEASGGFDECLRYGQDYDMWLHLLLRYPATYIPEPTVVQRLNQGQTAEAFPKAHFFDSSKAAIDLLNQCKFEQLVPLVDLSDPATAKNAVEKALDVATSFESPFLYGLGPHPALLWRILEWATQYEKQSATGLIQPLIKCRMQDVLARSDIDPATRFLWKTAYVVTCLDEGSFDYRPVPVDEVAKKRYWQLRAAAQRDNDGAALHHYLLSIGDEIEGTPPAPDPSLDQIKEVVIVCQKRGRIDRSTIYGAARAWIELAHYFTRAGKQVLVIGIIDNRLGLIEDIPYLGVQNEDELHQALQLLSPLDTLVAISRADIFLRLTIERPLIYQHGPHLPEGDLGTTLIRRLNLPVVVVSHDAMQFQRQHGVPEEQIHVVYNGYRADVFKLDETIARLPHRIVFAALGIFYKGLDIAVQAFLLLKKRYPDAELYVFGENYEWASAPTHLWPRHWLDQDSYPQWATIEQEAPGIHYGGGVGQAELAEAFQQSSLLIMPSRAHETFGLVSIEAQACGCIPVLPRQGGFPETMQEGITGYLYENNTPEELANTIGELWDHNLPSAQQRRQAAVWTRQEFSWQKTDEQIVKLLGPLSQREQRLLFLESFFWEVAIRWKLKARNTYDLVSSPALRRMLQKSYRFVRGSYPK